MFNIVSCEEMQTRSTSHSLRGCNKKDGITGIGKNVEKPGPSYVADRSGKRGSHLDERFDRFFKMLSVDSPYDTAILLLGGNMGKHTSTSKIAHRCS